MNESNNLMDSCYSNDTVYSTSWPKTKPISVAEQLEKWNKVRQSLYSQNGWCSENVNQISKWDVGDCDRNGQVPPNQMHKDGYETGTNNWNVNLSHPHHGSSSGQPYPPMQHDPFYIASNTTVTADPTIMSTINTPPQQQLTHWENTGAIPKIYNNNYNQHHHHHPTNLNCLSVTAPPNFEFPFATGAGFCPSQLQQRQQQQFASPESQNATVFYDCDSTNNMKPQPTAAPALANIDDDEVNLALRLQFDTMNLEQNFRSSETNSAQINNAPNIQLNPISRSICQMSNQYHHQVDCLPKAFL